MFLEKYLKYYLKYLYHFVGMTVAWSRIQLGLYNKKPISSIFYFKI